MKIEQINWTQNENQTIQLKNSAQLVLIFGSTKNFKNSHNYKQIRNLYPNAYLMGCSTSGEIYGTNVLDESLISTAIFFESSTIKGVHTKINENQDSYQAGEYLAKLIDKNGLKHVFILSEGINVNGTSLVKGLTTHLPENVNITGGLAGDGDRFEKTFVIWDDQPTQNTIALLGFYGDKLEIGCGSLGGWDSFGPERLITRSEGNILYEMDGKSALELYKNYLGKHADGLPATGLLFPLSIRTQGGDKAVVRTILSINEEDKSMVFAGDIPEGCYARLMKSNTDRLIDGALGAAKTSSEAINSASPDLAILISCVGRKMVLKQRVEEEVEAVQEIFGEKTVLTGFYSYGEISPFSQGAKCELHNQTMTITTLLEK